MRIDRMLAITILLLNRKRISARELARKFEVSVRTIYRDLDAIDLAGIPIVSYSGNNGGYGIMDNYKLDRQLLTLNDMLSMLSALKGINRTLGNKDLDGAIDKITSLVPKEKTRELNQYLEQFVIDILPWGFGEKQKQILSNLHQAILNCSLVNITYRDRNGEKSQRVIEPMTLLFKGYTWYLFAFCRERNDFRMFRLSRISQMESMIKNFERKNMSHKQMFSSGDDNQKYIDIKLKFSPRVKVRIEDYFAEEQIQSLDDGYMIVNIRFPLDEWVYSFIMGFADNVEVLEPGFLRTEISEKIKNMSTIYQT